MKFSRAIASAFALFLISFTSAQSVAAEKTDAPFFVAGGFELALYMGAGTGWQRFMGGQTTEWNADGTYAGVIGSMIPDVWTLQTPQKNEDIFEFFVPAVETDITKSFGDRAKLRADLLFGRTSSGSITSFTGLDIEQAYASVLLSKKYGVEFIIGRMCTVVGFEPYEPFVNDTISWSVLTHGYLYPSIVTGAQISFKPSEMATLYFNVNNGNTYDSTILRPQYVPSMFTALQLKWGDDARPNSFVLAPFFGPDSLSNIHWSFGADATLKQWLGKDAQLGLEGTFRRDDGNDGPNNSYAAGLLNLRYNFTNATYGVFKFAFTRQFRESNGFLNLTGARQNIFETSLGGGYYITDGIKLQIETRVDVITPSTGVTQYVPGIAAQISAAL